MGEHLIERDSQFWSPTTAFRPQKPEYAPELPKKFVWWVSNSSQVKFLFEIYIVESEIFFNKNTILKYLLSVLEIEVYF